MGNGGGKDPVEPVQGAGNALVVGPSGSWWDWRLLARWVLVNALAYIVIIVGGVALEGLASRTVRTLSDDHRVLAIAIVAGLGAGYQGTVLGCWQWRILRRRMPLQQRRWVLATLVPALVVWLFGIAPGAVGVVTRGGDAIEAFRFGFSRALVLGPLIGLSQATALRGAPPADGCGGSLPT
jgi:hypothetical protein